MFFPIQVELRLETERRQQTFNIVHCARQYPALAGCLAISLLETFSHTLSPDAFTSCPGISDLEVICLTHLVGNHTIQV